MTFHDQGAPWCITMSKMKALGGVPHHFQGAGAYCGSHKACFNLGITLKFGFYAPPKVRENSVEMNNTVFDRSSGTKKQLTGPTSTQSRVKILSSTALYSTQNETFKQLHIYGHHNSTAMHRKPRPITHLVILVHGGCAREAT